MASYPSSAAGDAQLSVAVNSLQTTLSGSIDSVVTSITLASATGFPSTGYVTIDSEVVSYTGISTNTLTGCTRGADGTTAASHTSGVPVSATIVAAHHNSLKNEVEAVETDLVAAFAAITPTTTNATDTNLTNRLKSLANQIRVGFGLTNWYDTISATFAKADLSNISGVSADVPMNSHKFTGLSAGSGAGDSVRYEQVLLLAGGTMSGAIAMGSNKITGLAAGTTNGDALRYEQLFTSSTVTLLGALAMGSNKITGLANGTASDDAAAFGQIKVLQTVTATSTTDFSTTSSTFQSTNLVASITPTSASNKILIFVSGKIRNESLVNTDLDVTVFRGATNLGNGTIGMSGLSGSTGDFQVPCHISFLDSPATTSSTTYTVKLRSSDNASAVHFGVGATTQSIVLMEVV